ncbi:C-C motif chemokine 3-like [Pimephales promelas]|nr:C-C motif chemokine 3-like [Pimephales promelas]
MRPCCNFIYLVLFTFCPLARTVFRSSECCFSFSKVRIPVKDIESYHITAPECPMSGIIFITKKQRKICADPATEWVQKITKSFPPIIIWARPEMAVTSSKVDSIAKKTIRTSETAPLQRPEETTLVHLIESNTEMESESVGTRGRTTLERADESAVVHLKESAYFCAL